MDGCAGRLKQRCSQHSQHSQHNQHNQQLTTCDNLHGVEYRCVCWSFGSQTGFREYARYRTMVAEHVTEGLITLTPPFKLTYNMGSRMPPCIFPKWNNIGSCVSMCLKSGCWPPTSPAFKLVTGFAAHSAARLWGFPTCFMPEPAFLLSDTNSVWSAMQPKGGHVTCT